MLSCPARFLVEVQSLARAARKVRALGPVASLRGRGHRRLGRVPLNLSLYFRQVGLSPKPGRPAWDEGVRQVQTQGSAQRDSVSVPHGPVLAKPGATALLSSLRTTHCASSCLFCSHGNWSPAAPRPKGPVLVVELGLEPAHHPYRPIGETEAPNSRDCHPVCWEHCGDKHPMSCS